MLAALLSTFLFSISVICGHRTARLIGGVEANFWRLLLGALLLGAWANTVGKGLTGDALPIFLLSGFIGIGIGDAGFFEALPRLGSRLSVLLIQCLSAPLAAVVEWLWLGTTLGGVQVLCALVTLAGVGVVLAPGDHLTIPRRQLVAGILFAILGAAGNGLGAVLSRKAYAIAHAAGESLDGGTAAYQRILGGLIVAAVLVLLVKRRFVRLPNEAATSADTAGTRDKWRKIWPWVAVNSLAGQALGVSCMQWALEHTPSGVVMAVIALTPIVVIPLARVFEGERVTARSLAGGAIAVAGAAGLALAK